MDRNGRPGNPTCIPIGGVRMMTKPNQEGRQFRPDHLGTQSRESDSNNGKKMNTKSNQKPDYIPPKG